MKPRSQVEREVVEISATLKPLNEAQKAYGLRHMFKGEAIIRKKDSKQVICLECGHKWTAEEEVLDMRINGATCPHCGRKVSIRISRQQYCNGTASSYQVIQAIRGWQVVRLFHVFKSTCPGSPSRIEWCEVVQEWVRPQEGKMVIMARNRYMGYYADNYVLKSPLSVKRDTYNSDYHRHAVAIYPRWQLTDEVKRRGWWSEMSQMHPSDTLRRLCNPHFETIAKARRLDIWKALSEREVDQWWWQVKAIIRHGYKSKDLSLLPDTLRMAEALGRSTQAPRHYMPADLRKEHDRLVKLVEAKREREDLERKAKEDADFRARMGHLLDIRLEDGDLTIEPLKCYRDYFDEGKSMHHCVSTYWGRDKCYILSAKIDGKRAATVEVNLTDMKVVQCRGVCNDITEDCERISELVTNNMNIIKKAINQ